MAYPYPGRRGGGRRTAGTARTSRPGDERSCAGSARGSALEQQRALAGVARERCCPLELGPRFLDAAELGEEIAPHGGQQMIIRECGLGQERVGDLEARRGPNAIVYATARFTSTTGDWVSWARASYSAVIRVQSVSSGVRARAWQAAMAAW